MLNHYLPAEVDPNRIVARIGLISDTHMPERWPSLPPVIFDIFQGVDLLLHAGDVGEMWVLDQLSQIAPVIAVHGNDDTPTATRELPNQQVITIAGQRLLLWHSHYPDRIDEMASRHYQDWLPKLKRIAERGRRAGAGVVIFGHNHVPMIYQADDILLVNPGAIASGNYFLRQIRQTVALLFIQDDGTPFIRHVDVAAPDQIFTPEVDLTAGFAAVSRQFEAPLLAPELRERQHQLSQTIFDGPAAVRAAYIRVCHRCWAGEQQFITSADILTEIRREPEISAADREPIERLLA
jgi:putative phosphoesterase